MKRNNRILNKDIRKQTINMFAKGGKIPYSPYAPHEDDLIPHWMFRGNNQENISNHIIQDTLRKTSPRVFGSGGTSNYSDLIPNGWIFGTPSNYAMGGISTENEEIIHAPEMGGYFRKRK